MIRVPLALAVALSLAATTAACSSPGGHGAVGPTSQPSPSDVAPTTRPATTAPVTTGAPSTRPACSDASVISSWPVTRRAAQLVVVPVLDANPAAVQVAVAAGAGGVLLLGSVPPGPQLVAALHAATTASQVPRPFVMTDQEGGGVQRLGSDVVSIPWPRQMAATMTTAEVRQLATTLGRQMAALGVGVDLAPVLDLDGGPSLSASDPDGPRSFSTEPSVASDYGLAFASGLRSAGVLAVVKHFPGLGESTGNTDYGPASTRPLSELEKAGLIPFQRAFSAGVGAVMVANATVPGLTTGPASVSPSAVTGLLRQRLGFSGLVMTDSLSAGAISAAGYTVASAAAASIEAGTDMVLFGSTLTPADAAQLQPGPLGALTSSIVAALSRAVASGALTLSRLDDAVLHVVRAKGVHLC